MIRQFLNVLFIAILLLSTYRSQAAPARPNLILILADDLGYGDVSCYGGKLASTPAIDSLARQGVSCSDGYVTAPTCAPSRCGIMTGAYNERFGIQWNDDRSKYTVGPHKLLPQTLKAAGYTTGHIGKWNVGADIKGCFDETHDEIDWEADYFPSLNGQFVGVDDPNKHDSSKIHGIWGPQRDGEEYLTDRIGRHAVEFIDKHRTDTNPFFLYLAFNAVHSPWEAKAEDRQKFAHIQPLPLQLYAAMLCSLDQNIGRVLAKLKAAGLEENTLVVFASDNGPAMMNKHNLRGTFLGDWPQEILMGSAGPLRGHKFDFFEGGIREPFILRWPGKLPDGTVFHPPVSTMDLYATFCAAANAPIPAGTQIDGVNLLPFLRDEKHGAPHPILFWKNKEQGAVRQGDWKLVLNSKAPKAQLFNLAHDLGEETDLANKNPEITERLHQAWLDWSAGLPAPASDHKLNSSN